MKNSKDKLLIVAVIIVLVLLIIFALNREGADKDLQDLEKYREGNTMTIEEQQGILEDLRESAPEETGLDTEQQLQKLKELRGN